MVKKILVVSKSFYPVNGPRSTRATELVKELARLGHKVTVLIPRNNDKHDVFEKEHNVTIVDLGYLYFSKKNGKNLPFWKKLILKTLIKTGIAHLISFPDVLYKNKTAEALEKHNDYDLLISIAKPHPIHWGVAKALDRNPSLTKKWIADCGDPFMGNPFHKPAGFFEKFERHFCEKADYIVVPIKEAIKSYYPEYEGKIRVIPQGFDFEKDKKDLSPYKPNDIPTFAYAGAFYKDFRDPGKLFEFLVDSDRQFKFIIYTAHADLVTPYLKKAAGRFVVNKYIPREELLRELSKMDFLININNVSAVQSPSKLIDYYLTGRPVLSLSNNQVEPEIMKEFLSGNYTHQYNFTNMDSYDIKNVARDFLVLS